jgi:hypothetical protein
MKNIILSLTRRYWIAFSLILFLNLLLLSRVAGWSPHCYATIDYSAANEYMEAHYGQSRYFDHAPRQPIYNARLGDEDGMIPELDHHGFELLELSSPEVRDWRDIKHVQQTYLPQLRALLRQTYPSAQQILFWHPMWRGTTLKQTTSTSPPAALVHIDTDVGAYELKDLLQLFRKNCLDGGEDLDHTEQAIVAGKRFLIVNAWRNIASEPVQRNPLALYRPIYEASLSFPQAPPKFGHWFWYPHMTPTEVLLFKQYDRRQDKISDLWHCALSLPESNAFPVRTSLDVRALLILDEGVPPHLDRYRSDRPRPLLSLQQSECFCKEQFSKHVMD